MHIFVFPQCVEKQVEKQKILGAAVFFHLLINFPFFNRLRDEKIISHLLYTYSAFRFFRSHCKVPQPFQISTFLYTFFPFPQGIFSRKSTIVLRSHLFHKTKTCFRISFHQKSHGKEKTKSLVASVFSGLFQLFYKPYHHYS